MEIEDIIINWYISTKCIFTWFNIIIYWLIFQCLLGEVPFFFLSGWIIKKIGHVNTMSLVLFGLGVRLILYSVISNPWWFLPIELSNGLTFGLFFACMASYASIVAPPGTEATMQVRQSELNQIIFSLIWDLSIYYLLLFILEKKLNWRSRCRQGFLFKFVQRIYSLILIFLPLK